jgi:hypothetical protein
MDEKNPNAYVCSPQCLRAFAAKASGEPDRLSPRDGRFKPRGKPAK